MRQTRKTLLTLLIFFLFLLIGIISLYESAILLPGKLSGDKSIVYVQMIMQLSTLALIPTALYLFRIPYNQSKFVERILKVEFRSALSPLYPGYIQYSFLLFVWRRNRILLSRINPDN